MQPGSRYVALGSSFAAGPGLGARVPGSPLRAGRTVGNYAHLIAAQLELQLTDVSFSGSTARQAIETPLGGEPPQLDAVGPDARLVTITCGGNDVQYIGGLVLAQAPALLRALPGMKRRLAALDDPAESDRLFGELAATLRELYATVRERAPEARVIVADYPTILPSVPDTDPDADLGRLPAAAAQRGRRVAARLAQTTRDAALDTGAEYIAVSEASAEHHAWSAEPWTNAGAFRQRGGASFHPNHAGMRATAELIVARLN